MKCRIPPRPLTEKQQEKISQRHIKQNDLIFNYVGRLISVSLRKNAGFGHTRFSRYNDSSFELGRAYIDRYSTDGDADEEYAVTSYYALRHDLRYISWDPEVELWREEVFDTLVPMPRGLTKRERDEHAGLVGYAKGISFYVREMLCMAAKELNNTNDFGRVRLNRVMHPVRDRYLGLMRLYIAGDRVGFFAELQKALDEFNALGFFKEEKL